MTTWYPEYVKFIEEMRTTPFEWGKNDCGLAWAGRFVEIVTGEKPDVKVRSYKTKRGAVRAMRELGYKNLKDMASGVLGREPQHPSRGSLGDLALIESDGALGYAFGIVNGERVFFRNENGIGTLDLLEASCIFKL